MIQFTELPNTPHTQNLREEITKSRIASLSELNKFIGLNEFIVVINLPGLPTNRFTTKELATSRIVALKQFIEFIDLIEFMEFIEIIEYKELPSG